MKQDALELSSLEEVETTASKYLASDGWTIFPSNIPSEGVCGLIAVRSEDGAEEKVFLSFRVFGPRIVRTISADTESKAVAALRAFEPRVVYRCDNPFARKLGLVHFEEPGYAEVVEVPLTLVKSGGIAFRGRPWPVSGPFFPDPIL